MIIINSIISAFLMYSKLPFPQVEWKEQNRRYALCFFPLVGAAIGAVFVAWQYFCINLEISSLLNGVVSMLIPLAITGGIHADGFCDVTDALSSYADRERKFKIMSDPHVGSFAVIKLCAYLILQTVLLAELSDSIAIAIIPYSYVLSRCLSGLAAVTFRNAKKSGTLQNFSKPAHRTVTIAVLLITGLYVCISMLSADRLIGAFSIVGALLSFLYYRLSAYKNFGGITGDLAGWFLQICEISILIFATVAEVLSGVIIK